jgi:hypothetical protein
VNPSRIDEHLRPYVENTSDATVIEENIRDSAERVLRLNQEQAVKLARDETQAAQALLDCCAESLTLLCESSLNAWRATASGNERSEAAGIC